MSTLFLVQSVSAISFRRLAKGHFSAANFDCYDVVTSYFAFTSKREAVDYCRRKNRERDVLLFFVHPIICY